MVAFIILILVIPLGIIIPFIIVNVNRNKKIQKAEFEKNQYIEKAKKQFEESIANYNFINDKTIQHNKIYFAIDNFNKNIYIQSDEISEGKLINYKNILSYEVYQDGETLAQGRAGSAAIGGLLFGVAGAVVGSSMAKSSKEVCNKLQLRLTVNDVINPEIVLTFLNSPAYKTGVTYAKAFNAVKEIAATLNVIQKQGE